MATQLLGLEGALSLSRKEACKLTKSYGNKGLVKLLDLLDLGNCYSKARGCKIWDLEGQEYLDAYSAFSVLVRGHNPPDVREALINMLRDERVIFSQTGISTLKAALSHDLAQFPGALDQTFFCNSGAEAIEASMKFARDYTGKPGFVSYLKGFHGKTFGALSVTGNVKYQEPFTPLLSGCRSIPLGDLAALKREFQKDDVAGVVMEPVLGEGGVLSHEPGFMKAVQELCNQNGVCLIMDCIQTGFGRTGHMFGFEHEGVQPDIICLAKALGGGYGSLGATMVRKEIWDSMLGGDKCLNHTSTFEGNGLDMTAALVTVKAVYEEGLPAQSLEKGKYLLDGLRSITEDYPDIVKEVRGEGLLCGMQLNIPEEMLVVKGKAYEYGGSLMTARYYHEYGIQLAYTLNNPSTIRIAPPLTVSYAQIDYILQATREILEENQSLGSLMGSTTWSFIGNKTGLSRLRQKKQFQIPD